MEIGEENCNLAKQVADISPYKLMLQYVPLKILRPADRKGGRLSEKTYRAGRRHSCLVLRLNSSICRCRPRRDEQAFLGMRIKEPATVHIH